MSSFTFDQRLGLDPADSEQISKEWGWEQNLAFSLLQRPVGAKWCDRTGQIFGTSAQSDPFTSATNSEDRENDLKTNPVLSSNTAITGVAHLHCQRKLEMIGLVTVGNHHFEQIKVVFENVKVIQSESTSLKLIIIQPLGGKTNKLLPSVFWSVDVKVLCGITQEELFHDKVLYFSQRILIISQKTWIYWILYKRKTLVLVSKRYGWVAGSSSACVGGSLGLKRSLVTQVVMEKSRFIKAEFIRLSFGFWLLFFKSTCKILYRHLLKLDLI